MEEEQTRAKESTTKPHQVKSTAGRHCAPGVRVSAEVAESAGVNGGGVVRSETQSAPAHSGHCQFRLGRSACAEWRLLMRSRQLPEHKE